MPQFRTLLVDVSERVGTITLNRPERMNAFTPEMGSELYATLADFDRDDDVRAIVITGAGRAFCAGADLASGGDTFATEKTWGAGQADVRPWNLKKPIIAAINGAAVGVGATLPLQWDIRIASENAKIGFVFTRRGIIPEAYSTWILPRLVGFARAMDLLLTGRILTANEALEHGIVSRVVPADELMKSARAIALDIAKSTAPVSIAITKRLLWRQMTESDPLRAKELEDELFYWIGKQPDAAEGVKSFLEKREAAWSMRPSTDLPDLIADVPETKERT